MSSSLSASDGYVYRSSTPRRAARPPSLDDDLLPPNLDDEGEEGEPDESSFRSWLASGILDLLGTAAGVTLSTTGRLVAPPLHVTQTILLPAILDLLVDTLDSITPKKVQDWFRILSSSFHHLVVVLGSTDKGKDFSRQLYVVLQDFLQASSAPESRQVLVEGMATSVKLIDAMHTPETKEFLEQLATLGVRLLDAAGSGKTKQLIHNSKDLAWKGIEMATDPATTVALAEVTAHLCHALEDAHQSLNPPSMRSKRDAPTRSTYISPYQMVDTPEQVSTEEIILNGLGVKVYSDEKPAEPAEPIEEDVSTDRKRKPNRVRWHDEVSQATEATDSWQYSKDKVNVEVLRESILRNKLSRSSKIEESNGDFPELVSEKRELAAQFGEEGIIDMEDIAYSDVPGGRRNMGVRPNKNDLKTHDTPEAVKEFYAKLDEFLANNRIKEAISDRIGNSKETKSKGQKESQETTSRKPRATKLKRVRDFGLGASNSYESAPGRVGSRFANKHQIGLVLLTAASVGLILSILFLALFGLFSLFKTAFGGSQSVNHDLNEEVILRLIQDILRAKETTDTVGLSGDHFSAEDL